MAQRIQRKRTKGWRMPEGATYVGRGSKWGNPFKGEVGAATMTRQMLADYYFKWLMTPTRLDANGRQVFFNGCAHFLGVPYEGRPTLDEIRATLAGRDLACWCPLEDEHGNRVPCHADVLLALANRTEGAT